MLRIAAVALTIFVTLLYTWLSLSLSPTRAYPTSAQSISYSPDPNDVLNPERGFRPSYDDLLLLNDWHFAQARSNGHSLVYSYIYLASYRNSDTLPTSLLQGISDALDAARRQGVKLILRVAYNFGPYPNSEPDAPLSRILAHIQQLAPVFQAHADVIAWFHAGFIGAWGEWHSSTHGLHNDWSAKSQGDPRARRC